MSWTTPRTWVTGEVVTSTIMNAHVRDNLGAVPVALASSQSVTTTFASGTLPTAFQHLVGYWRLTSSRAAVEDVAYLRFNGDSSSLYNYGYVQLLNTTVSGANGLVATLIDIGAMPGADAGYVSAVPGSGVFFVPSHRQGSGKSLLGLTQSYYGNTGASWRQRFVAGNWQSNAAVTSVTIGATNGTASGEAAIYGLPGA